MNKQLYIIHHSHKHGDSIHLVRSNSEPTEEEIVKLLHLEFKPDEEEFIDISSCNDDDIEDLDDLRHQCSRKVVDRDPYDMREYYNQLYSKETSLGEN